MGSSKKLLTLCMLYNPNQVLLALKKRGFGANRWNGFGGKVEEGESIKEAASRELWEEGEVENVALEERGILEFSFEEKPGEILEVHLFGNENFYGIAKETEEMRPEWFNHDAIPYEKMWPDDRIWLPRILKGENVKGAFHFYDEGKIKEYTLEKIT